MYFYGGWISNRGTNGDDIILIGDMWKMKLKIIKKCYRKLQAKINYKVYLECGDKLMKILKTSWTTVIILEKILKYSSWNWVFTWNGSIKRQSQYIT